MDINENKKKNEEQKKNELLISDGSESALIVSEHSVSKDAPKKAKKAKGARSGIFGYVGVSLCLVLALLIMIGSIASPVERIETPVFNEDESEDERRLIYVNGVFDGGMSTPEIYSACSESVVSISAEGRAHTGVGSGFIISEDGYIATANHVVSGAEWLTVILSDGSEYSARVIAGDDMTDLALLKIDADELKFVKIGDSSELLAGERVVAIGTPASLDYAGSVCSGEISFPRRVVKIYGENGVLDKKMTLIQTDAPVNPGNSGCPLFDAEGRVIGIVTMKLGQNFSGVGFAIPINEANDILSAMKREEAVDEALISAVSVRGARLGVLAEAFDSNGLRGVRVTDFISNEYDVAKKLKLGDVIVSVGKKAVTGAKKLSDAINEYSPGDAVAITVYREGQNLTFEVVLGS